MKKRSLASAAVVASGLLLLTACSSSSSSAPAPSGSTSGGSSAAVAAAAANVKAYSVFPTKISVTTPLPSAPPKGKTVVFLQCEQQQCGYEGQGMQAAVNAIGWNLKILNFQGANPATLVAALKTALQYNPVGVYFSGVPQVAWQSEQAAYAAAGSYITANFLGSIPTGAGVKAGRGYDVYSGKSGTLLADAQIVDSNGSPGNSILVNVPAYTLFDQTVKQYHAGIASVCPSCTVTDVNITLPQLFAGGLNAAVVSAAKRIPNLSYIASVNGSFIGQLPGALQTAGLAGKYKLISGTGSITDQQNVLDGKQLSTQGDALTLGGWQNVDMAIRTVMNLPADPGDNEELLVQLTKDNIGTPQVSSDYPADYAAQFKALWKVG